MTDSLVAVPLDKFLDGRADLRAGDWLEREAEQRRPGGDKERPVPVSPDGSLQSGELYESSADPQARYYLPAYQLHTAAGRHATALRLNPDSGDPTAPLAWLTVELVAPPPPSRALRLLEIPHRAVARLGYSLPVQGADGTVRAAGAEPALWVELGAVEPPDAAGVRRCRHPIHAKPDFDRIFQAMTDLSFGAVLELRCFAVVGHRSYRQIVMARSSPMLAEVSRLVARDAPLGAAPAADAAEDVAAPPLYQLLIDTPPADSALGGAPGAAPAPLGGGVESAVLLQLQRPPALDALRARVPTETIRDHRAPRIPVERDPEPTRRRDLSDPRGPVVRLEPAIIDRIRDSDLVLEREGVRRPAVPVGVIVGDDGEPALLRVEAEARQRIAFHFPLEANRDMFDLPAAGAAVHKLLKATVGEGERTIEVYQDLGLPGQFYYEPREFRLARTALLPGRGEYHPHLLAAVTPLVSPDAAGTGADVLYCVKVAYQAIPYVEAGLIDRARAELAGGDPRASFTPLVPRSSRLTLRLPSDAAGGDFVDQPREHVEVSFDSGISDSLTLSQAEFRTIFSSLAAGGVYGTVQVELLDGRAEAVPLRLSFAETAGPLFDVTYNGPTGEPGVCRVTLRNRIESPVQIGAAAPVEVRGAGGAGTAFPQPLAATDLAPGAPLTIDYRIDPPGLVPPRLEPALSASVRFDARQLWERLLINGGYTADSFTIEAAAEPEFFAAPPVGADGAALDPIVGLRVEFDCGVTAVLTAAAPRQGVTLRMPLLDFLLNDAAARRYRYQVTDLHRGANGAEYAGARAEWAPGEGDLAVAPALSTVPVSG